MRFLSFITIFSTIIFLGSCNKEDLSPNTSDADFDVPIIIPKGDENYLTMDSDYVFDQNALHTFELKISESNLAFLDADPVAEEYVEGMLIFQGDTISPVGVRYKGSVGAFVGCLSGGNVFAPSGEKTCTKLSMKIQINWEGRDEKFFKQKKLQFHSMNLDPTQMHERLGYWLFRELGVPGPRSVHSRLLINDEYVGLFALTEQIDNRMIKYNFDDDDGNLYKEIWPLSMSGEPYSDQKYIDALKTNEDDNPSIDLIKNFGEEIKNASSTDVNAIVEQYMNIDEIISYAVVDRTIRHDDGPFHWYCGGNDCSNHNYYWYEELSKNELHLIPWDLGNAFENINNNANPVTLIADDWGETSNNCEPFPFGGFGIEQWSASCDKLIKSWSTNTELYDQKKQLLINGSMSVASTDQILTDWQNQIKAATVEASDMHNDALSLVQWEAAIMNLKEQLEFARNN